MSYRLMLFNIRLLVVVRHHAPDRATVPAVGARISWLKIESNNL